MMPNDFSDHGRGGPAVPTLGYSRAVDGLRAVSILAVVAHHAVPGWVPGGFVGVDVFFVISGFLIINQIALDLASGRFSLADFWARRALRILPPFLLVVVASLFIGLYALTLPDEFHAFGRSVSMSGLMLVNVRLLRDMGYFAPDADTVPLLHMWSLAAEEQFYVVAPLAMIGIWWLLHRFAVPSRRGAVLLCGAILFVASLAACVVATGVGFDKNPAFYLMPYRAWEFIAGGASAIAAHLIARRPRRVASLAGLAGLAAIAVSLWSLTPFTPYPSFYALLPVAGAFLAIAATVASPSCLAARLLSIRPMVAIGVISYAWYLWHWPLLVFGRIYDPLDSIPWRDLWSVVLSLLLAAATYALVEKPIKQWRRRRAGPLGWRPVFAGAAGCAVVALAGIAVSDALSPALARRYADILPAPAEPFIDPRSGPVECQLVAATPEDCLAVIGGRPAGLLIGDSHAGVVYPVLAGLAADRGVVLASGLSLGCIASITVAPHTELAGPANPCLSLKTRLASMLEQRLLPVRFAILSSYWQVYLRPANFGPPYLRSLTGPTAADQDTVFARGLAETIDLLREGGVERVLILAQVPVQPHNTTTCVLKAIIRHLDVRRFCTLPVRDLERSRSKPMALIRQVIEGMPDVRLIDPAEALCGPLWCDVTDADGRLLYLDDDHLTDAGVAVVTRRFKADIDWAMGAAP